MSWTRRLFLKETAVSWLGLVIAPGAYALFCRALYHRSSTIPKEVIIGRGEEFALKSSEIVYLGSEKILIGRSSDGSFHAVSAVCTHRGCSIRFYQHGTQEEFACNCHASRFDLAGGNLSGPATIPLKQYEVSIVGDNLVVSAAKKAGT
jgi:Rieske Fe-S protein